MAALPSSSQAYCTCKEQVSCLRGLSVLLTHLILASVGAHPLILSIYRGGEATARFVADFDVAWVMGDMPGMAILGYGLEKGRLTSMKESIRHSLHMKQAMLIHFLSHL